MKDTKTWKGTPGPWVAQSNNFYWDVRNMDQSERLLSISSMLYPKDMGGDLSLSEENEANADALAAAPDMVELTQMLDLYLMEKVEGLPRTVSEIDLRMATDKILKKLDL